jgi:hypothetical protein
MRDSWGSPFEQAVERLRLSGPAPAYVSHRLDSMHGPDVGLPSGVLFDLSEPRVAELPAADPCRLLVELAARPDAVKPVVGRRREGTAHSYRAELELLPRGTGPAIRVIACADVDPDGNLRVAGFSMPPRGRFRRERAIWTVVEFRHRHALPAARRAASQQRLVAG